MADYVSEWASAADAAATGLANLGAQIGGIKAQKESNRVNQEMNALNNATQRAIAEMNNAEAVRLWELQSRYNSPAHQVALLGQAGFTPNALLGSAGFNKTFGAGAPPQLQKPELTPGHVEPVTFGADAALGLGDRLSQFMVNLSSAKKLQSETVGQNLANESYTKQVAAQLRALGASTDAQEIENKFKADKESEELRNLRSLGFIQEQQYRQLMLANNLTSIFGEDKMKAEINEIVQRAFALEEQGKTEESKRLLNDALTDKAKSEAEYTRLRGSLDRYFAPLQGGLIQAQTANLGALTQSQLFLNALDKVYSIPERSARYLGQALENYAKKKGIILDIYGIEKLKSEITSTDLDNMAKTLNIPVSTVRNYLGAAQDFISTMKSVFPAPNLLTK